MFASLRFPSHALLLACAVAVAGCLPSAQGPADEQREPHFIAGKGRAASLDFKGAIEAFEAALEANPRNGSAHYELGLLCEREGDFAAAIYHLQRYLKLRPDDPKAQIIQDRIAADKVELSKTAAFAPVTQNLEREFQKLAEEKQQLRAELERTRTELEQWRTYAARPPAGQSPPPGNVRPPDPQPAPPAGTAPPAASRPRTHTVQNGETLTSIAARYRVTVAALQAANPDLDPRRMRAGKSIRIPAAPAP